MNAEPRIETLSREECLALLAEQSFGRVCVSLGEGAPVIRPVNYAFHGPSQSIVFRTGSGSKLHALLHSAHAAFEVDGIDAEGRSGWSVIVTGVTEEVTRSDALARLEQIGLDTWAPGHRGHWLQIRARAVSGRRVVS